MCSEKEHRDYLQLPPVVKINIEEDTRLIHDLNPIQEKQEKQFECLHTDESTILCIRSLKFKLFT